MALSANPDHYGAQVQLKLVHDAPDTTAEPAKPLSDQEFFVRLREESADAAENLLEAIETSGLAPKLDLSGQLVLMWLGIIAKYFIMLVPALLTGVLVGTTVAAMGFGATLPNIGVITLVFFLITWVQKQGYW